MQQKTFDLNTLNGINGLMVPGITSGDELGVSVSTAGDINGDNISDLVLGAYYANAYKGAAYVIFGSRRGFVSSFSLNNLNGSNGFMVSGIASNGRLGYSVSTAGDINGDNITDLVLGAYYANSQNGAAYVIFGSRRGFVSTFSLNNLNGSNGFTIPAIASSGYLGISVSTAGDINGDNITDLVLGAPYANSVAGTSYVIFGTRAGFPSVFNLANLNGTNGFTVPGVAAGGQLGVSVSTAGDLNGDGLSDLVLGANTANAYNGTAYVIFGSRGGFVSPFNLANLNGSNGFMVPGIASSGQLGFSVSTAGDINGDNLTDLVLGALYANLNNGAAYVIFGSRGGFVSPFNLTNLNGNNGFMVPDIASNGYLGTSVSTAGDINGDGISDLVLGATGVNSTAGASYVIFGGRGNFASSFDLTNLNGTNGFTIPGTASNGELGVSVSTAGDINGDGISDFVLGAYQANSSTGVSYVIFGGSGSLTFIKNELAITEGQTVVLTLGDLNAFSFGRFGLLVFTVSNVQGGRFERVNQSGTGIFNFTQQQIVDAQIQFVSDRTAKVAFVTSVNDGNSTIGPEAADVTFINHAPLVVNSPMNQVFKHDRPFTFNFIANQTFLDPDGDPLTFVATSTNGASLPNWIQFDTSQNNQLTFTGVAPFHTVGTNELSLFASDLFNATTQANFNVTFVNNPPVVINQTLLQPQVTEMGKSFDFSFEANTIFSDPDGDPLTFFSTSGDGSVLPNWVHFDTNVPNQLTFTGISPTTGNLRWRLWASDPINATAYEDFDVVTVPANNVANVVNNGASITEIAGSVVGSLLGLGAIVGAGFGLGFWKKNKDSRSQEQFADFIRSALHLKGVDNFDHETGQKYLTFVHGLQKSLQQAGIDPSAMRPGELRELANDVATVARNKITSAANCLGQSAITVTDLNDNLQSLVTEVQVLRSAGQQRGYVV
jgi:hypothetical protein